MSSGRVSRVVVCSLLATAISTASSLLCAQVAGAGARGFVRTFRDARLSPTTRTYQLAQVRWDAARGTIPFGPDLPRWTGAPPARGSTRTTSLNWSGYTAVGSGYTAAEGAWTVPPIAASQSEKDVSTWVGVGGASTTQSLVQVITLATTHGGSTAYYAQAEVITGGVTVGNVVLTPALVPVLPGDRMVGLVEELGLGRWRVELQDVTRGWTVETTTVAIAFTSGTSAEWITERPLTGVTGQLTTLADFGSAHFHDLLVNSGAAQSALDADYMHGTTGRQLLAYPGPFSTATTGSFTDFYAATSSPPPVTAPGVGSLTPRTGPATGGTSVTITGAHLSGATSVLFGSAPATAFRVTSATRIIASSPPGSGTVDVTVTTAGGSSAVSGADQFTYVNLPPTAPTFTRVYGQTADATAAAELEHQFPYASGTCPASRSVVLATDANFPDALASAYLARSLGTGTLLTPTGSLSAPTGTAIADEGIDHVYVVGGPLAVSTSVVTTIESMRATGCGGSSGTGGSVAVTRISGATEYDTAERIATSVPHTRVGSLDVSGAYGGAYDATGGAESPSAPAGSPRTAILATGKGFQDAESASTFSYGESLPILLTTGSTLSAQAAGALGTLGVTQVVLMGGQLAVSNQVVTELEGLGISVLRVSGTTYTGTAAELATLELQPAPDGAGWTGTGALTVARGDYYSDGLAGAVVAADGPSAATREPLLLTFGSATMGSLLTAFLRGTARDLGVHHLTVLGGPYAVSQTVVAAMLADL